MKICNNAFLILFLTSISHFLHGQCAQTIRIEFLSINYSAGCDYDDTAGLDPKLDIFGVGGGLIYTSHYGDQSQVTGPMDNVPIDDTVTDNECGNFDTGFGLGTFDSTVESVDVNVDIYEKDSNIINDQCSGYTRFIDDDLSQGSHTFDLTASTGTIDVGGCMSYNYRIDKIYEGGINIIETSTLCPEDTLIINGTAYHIDNPSDNFTIAGNPTSCDTNYIVDLQFFAPPQLEILRLDSLCSGGTQSLTTSFIYDAYEWSDGETSAINTSLTPGQYTVTVTSENGCEQTSAFEITEVIVEEPVITGEDFFCTGSSLDLELSNPLSSQQWSTGSTARTITIDTPGEYTVIVTDASGCTNSSSVNITIEDNPIINLPSDLQFCAGDSLILTPLESFENYNWSSGASTAIDTITIPGNYQLAVTDINGCTSETTFEVIEIAAPSPIINGNLVLCADQTTMLNVEDIYSAYMWNDGNTSPELMISSGGTYSITVTDMDECQGTAEFVVTEVNSLTPDITGDLSFCDGESTTLVESTPSVMHLWSDGSTANELLVEQSGDFEVTITDNNGCTGIAVVTVEATTFDITAIDSTTCFSQDVGTFEETVDNGTACPDILITNITLADDEACDIDYLLDSSAESCMGAEDGRIEITITDAIFPVSYSITQQGGMSIDGTLATSDDIIIAPTLTTGNYNVILESENGIVETFITIIESDIIDLITTTDQNISIGTSATLAVDIDTSLYATFYWAEGTERLCEENCLEIVVMPDSTTVYNFIAVLADSNCEELSEVTVFVSPLTDIYIPTVFDPSETGDNGIFRPLGPGAALLSSMEIYDRWGNLVHSSTSADNGWAGRFDNQLVDSGVYVYRIVLDSEQEQQVFTGSITVIR